MAFLDWSTTAGSNTSIGGIGIQGSNAVQNFDNAFREMMAQLRSGVDGKVALLSKSANYSAVANDNNAVIRFSAAATLSLPAAASAGSGWHCLVIADGGAVIVDPNASETINGSATLTVPDGYSAVIICDGTNFRSTKDSTTIPAAISSAISSITAVKSVVRKIFTASGTYTPTAGMVYCDIECVGGGGGGGGTTASSTNMQASAGGGGGGEYALKRATAADIGASKSVTIGAGGAGGAAGLNNGTAGGDTSVGTLCVAKGGSPGIGNNANSGSVGGDGGTGGTGDLLIPGGDGGDGGGGQLITVDTFSGNGGATKLGNGAKARRSTSADGRNGKSYGSGGAGGMDRNASAGRAGGNGAAGIVIITEYIA